jgi:LysM repeat protein
MNRRDIIIIAVLINTGLLSALVMMAISTDDQTFVDQTEFNQILVDKPAVESLYEKEPLIIAQNTTIATDEWDSVLKDYVASSSSQLLQEDEPVLEIEKEVVEPVKVVKEFPKKIVKPLIATNPKKTIEITVKRGDALEKIARANGTTVEEIRSLNQLKNDRLTIGQVLLVAAANDKPLAPQIKAEPVAPVQKLVVNEEVEYYVIKSGDNPWKIAKQFKVKFDDLLKLNNLDEEKARNLKIGDRIRVK